MIIQTSARSLRPFTQYKETWIEWGPSVPAWLLNICWEVFDEISQMCSLGKHNQVDTLALFLSCQHTSPVNLRDTQVWVCNLPYAGCYRNCLQTRTLQLLKFIESMPEKGWSVNRAPPNHYRFCAQIKYGANATPAPFLTYIETHKGPSLFPTTPIH